MWLQFPRIHRRRRQPQPPPRRILRSAAQVESAFHASLHAISLDGRTLYANRADPQIPAVLASTVAAVVSLNNLPRTTAATPAGVFRRNNATGAVTRPDSTVTAAPAVTITSNNSTYYAITPWDFAALYDVLPLWNATTPITGIGETIAIAGDTDINPADVVAFRNLFSLPLGNTSSQTGTQYLNIIYNGPQPAVKTDEYHADADTPRSRTTPSPPAPTSSPRPTRATPASTPAPPAPPPSPSPAPPPPRPSAPSRSAASSPFQASSTPPASASSHLPGPSFTSGSLALGTSIVVGGSDPNTGYRNATSTLTLSAAPFNIGSDPLTVTYSGDTDYLPVTSSPAPLTVTSTTFATTTTTAAANPQLVSPTGTILFSAAILPVNGGNPISSEPVSSGTVQFIVDGQNYGAPVAVTSGLASCSFAPTSPSVIGTAAVTTTLMILLNTGVHVSLEPMDLPRNPLSPATAFAGLLGLCLPRRTRRMPLLHFALLLASLAAFTGCGSASGASPTGTYTINVSASGSTTTQTATITLKLE